MSLRGSFILETTAAIPLFIAPDFGIASPASRDRNDKTLLVFTKKLYHKYLDCNSKECRHPESRFIGAKDLQCAGKSFVK